MKCSWVRGPVAQVAACMENSKAEVGEKRDRQERVMRGGSGGHTVSALVLIRQVQLTVTGVTSKRQRKMAESYQKNTPAKTTRGEMKEKSNTKKKSRNKNRRKRRKQKQQKNSSGGSEGRGAEK